MNSNNYNLKEILDEVRTCTLLCCTDNGKVYSSSAEKYLKWLEGYTSFVYLKWLMSGSKILEK